LNGQSPLLTRQRSVVGDVVNGPDSPYRCDNYSPARVYLTGRTNVRSGEPVNSFPGSPSSVLVPMAFRNARSCEPTKGARLFQMSARFAPY